MNFTRQQIADACRKAGAANSLTLPMGLDLTQLLWAICGNESSFGANCNPRHEPAFDVGGNYAQAPAMAALLEKYGSHAACSYGPMQVMLVNAPAGYTPQSFDDVDASIKAGLFALSNLVIHWQPKSLPEIGGCYNGGNPHALNRADVQEYARKLLMHYEVAMPAAV